MWKYEQRNQSDKPTKVPYYPNGKRAQSNNPETFTTFETALKSVSRYDGMGIGIFGGISAVEIDHCIDESGKLSDLAKSITELFDGCYVEKSPSGKGVRILFYVSNFVYDKVKYYINNQKLGLEVYVGGATSKYVSVTGNVLKQGDILDMTDRLQVLLDTYMLKAVPKSKTSVKSPKNENVTDKAIFDIVCNLRKQKNGAKFIKLYDKGDISDYPSHSEADVALCGIIAFRTGADFDTIDKIFRRSALYREKWERDDYRQSAINAGINACNGVFYKQKSECPYFIKFEEKTGKPFVSVPLLAKYVRENLHYVLVRDNGKQALLKYVYENGKYRLYADNMFMGLIKHYISEYDEELVRMSKVNETFMTALLQQSATILLLTLSINSVRKINSSGVCLASWSCVVPHDPDGSKSCYIAATWSIPNVDTSAPPWGSNYNLTQIPRKSTPTLSSTNFNIGSGITVYTNRASGTSFTHDIYMYNGSGYDLLASGVGVSWAWDTSNIYSKIPGSQQFNSHILLRTWNGGTNLGDNTVGFTANIDINANRPDVSFVAYDTNQTTLALTGDNQKLISGHSNLYYAITASAKNGASIAAYQLFVGSTPYNFQTSTVNGITSGSLLGAVADSRNVGNTLTRNLTIVPYFQPLFSKLEVTRLSSTSNTVNLSYAGTFFNGSFGAVSNALTIKYRWRIKTADNSGTWSSYIALTPTVSSNNFNQTVQLGTNFDFQTAYEFEVAIQDKLVAYSNLVTLTKGLPLIDIGETDININGSLFINGGACLPVGIVIPCFKGTADVGYVLCDGRALTKAAYPRLWQFAVDNWGVSNTSTSFNVPDFKGRTLVMPDGSTEFPSVGSTFGKKYHTLLANEMPSHLHDGIYWALQTGGPPMTFVGAGIAASYAVPYTYSGGNGGDNGHMLCTAYAGGDQPHNNIQPSVGCNYQIKY